MACDDVTYVAKYYGVVQLFAPINILVQVNVKCM